MWGSSLLERGLLEPCWRYPQTLTVFGTLASGRVSNAIADIKNSRDQLGLDQLNQLHVFRIAVVDGELDLRGRMLPPRMIVSVVFEGSAAGIFAALIQAGGDRLKQILQYCDDFPKYTSIENMQQWMLSHAESPQAYHIGTLRDDLRFMREEYRLRVAIGNYVDQQQAAGTWQDSDVVAIHRDIGTFVRSQSDLPQGPRPPDTWRLRLLEWLDVLRILITLALLPAILAVLHVICWQWNWLTLWWLIPAIFFALVAIFEMVVRFFEITEGDLVVKPRPGQVSMLVADEDFGIQNQYTMLAHVRDSWFRRLSLRFVLWFANGVSKHWYRAGQLVGIDTIHFARFHLIDNGRRMLFLSDFDGGWERYLFDFLSVGSLAVVPIWTHLHGCPKTVFLRFTTKGFAQRFIPFTRALQRPTHLWYNAAEHLTVSEIKRHSRIRAGLYRQLSQQGAEEWLKLI